MSAGAGRPSPGALLRAARESRGISIEEAAGSGQPAVGDREPAVQAGAE